MKNWLSIWWHKHRTKTLGFLAMLIGAAQANFSEVQSFIPANKQGLVLFAFGVLTAALGFLNSNSQ